MSSNLAKDEFSRGTMSRAGKASAERFNIIKQISILKEKNSLHDAFLQEPNISDYIQKEKENKLNSGTLPVFYKTPKQGLKLKINMKKYFKDYIQKSINKTLMIHQNQKFRNNYKQKKMFSLNNTINNSRNLLMTNYNKFNLNKNIVKKESLSPFYNKIKYKFHNIHLNRLKSEQKNKKKKEKDEPIYRPKLEFIYNKSLTGPEWNRISGRKKILFDESLHSLDKFYDSELNSFHEIRNSFINMAKQTRRNSNIFCNDLRNRNESKFIPKDLSKSSIYKKIKKFSTIPRSPFSRDNPQKSKKKLSLRSIKNFSNFKLYKSETPSIKSYKFTPDFKRYLGRYKDHKLVDKRIQASNEGIYYPNYDTIQERTKMMVLYGHQNKKENEKNFNFNKFKGVSTNELFNISDAFNKYKLYKSRIAPKFEKMISRPIDKSLPSFMQGLYNRIGADIMSDKSLKLNNYSNGESYYDIYKNNSTISKSPKKEDDNLHGFNNDKEYDIEESKVNEIEEEEKVIKMDKEINKIISKMDNMYNNYINSKF